MWAALPLLLVAIFGAASVFATMAVFFSKMAVVTFGGAYAVLAYVAQQAVETLGWLQPGEMLDGLAMAETTPGPLILVLTYVGFLAAFRDAGGLDPLLAGFLGAVLTTWVTFIPCFLWIFLGAPYIETLRGNRAARRRAVRDHRRGRRRDPQPRRLVRPARPVRRGREVLQLGPLSPSVPVLATLDPWAALLAAGAMVAMFRFKVGMLPTLAGCAAAGALIQLAI